MKFGKTVWRALALGAAAAILPCCKTDVGQGDELALVTVRVSVGLDGQEVTSPPVSPGSDGCVNCSISADGRYVAFESTSNQLTSGDSNGLRDILIKDRLTGAVENITNLVSGEFGPFPANNFNPAISGDGRFVAFESTGIYIFGLFPPITKKLIWVYDRSAKTFVNACLNIFAPANQDCLNPSLSYDGRYVAWATTATNIQGRNAGGTAYSNPGGSQVYVTDLTMPAVVDIVVLASHASGVTSTGANGGTSNPRISGNGRFVTYASTSTNLAAGDADATLDVYVCDLGTAGFPNTLESIGLNPVSGFVEKGTGLSMSPAISSDGRYVAFASSSANWGFGSAFYVARRDRMASVTQLVAPDLGTIVGFILVADRVDISGDGQSVVYVNSPLQVAVSDMNAGTIQVVSVNISGAVSNRQPFKPSISLDGTWATWHTLADNLVASDTNGVNDIFVRGPLR